MMIPLPSHERESLKDLSAQEEGRTAFRGAKVRRKDLGTWTRYKTEVSDRKLAVLTRVLRRAKAREGTKDAEINRESRSRKKGPEPRYEIHLATGRIRFGLTLTTFDVLKRRF